MVDEKKECCTTGCGPCCMKAFFAGLLVGVILISAGFGIAMGSKCLAGGGMKVCPISGVQTQK